MSEQYSVHALRYAQSVGKRSSYFYGYHLSDQPDAEQHVDWYFWLLKSGNKTVLVDCGYDTDRAARKGRYVGTNPLELLSRMGVAAGDIDHVVISHAHYDHVGNIGLFPNAEFTLARSEFDWITGPYADRFPTCWVVEEEERTMIQNFARDGRFHFVDDRAEVLPGLVAWAVGGHTPGQMLVEIAATTGQVVLASDAAHFAEEYETDRPFGMFHNLEDLFAGYEQLRDLNGRTGTVVVPGHDPRVSRTFAEVEKDCFDLTSVIAHPVVHNNLERSPR
ncbi:N-acyl homoserine lactonase family protein [Rhodococcus opacus]|uniref:N-acyl homoserine lactonase family protein n=1 Tax=Rhodococcus opacus TaxID=37919 RepID=UPI001C46A44A|nr:N-acyl homoserine lactonase family protein [Rhodococcus opacus]MBV6759085.1 N-acyl homoserine lactonase family protein [Rhodococcus opacus]